MLQTYLFCVLRLNQPSSFWFQPIRVPGQCSFQTSQASSMLLRKLSNELPLRPFLVPVAGEGGSWIPQHSCGKERGLGLDRNCSFWKQRPNIRAVQGPWTAGKILFYPPYSPCTCWNGFLLCSLILSWLHLCPVTTAKPGISRECIYRSTFTDCRDGNANFCIVQLVCSASIYIHKVLW